MISTSLSLVWMRVAVNFRTPFAVLNVLLVGGTVIDLTISSTAGLVFVALVAYVVLYVRNRRQWM
jgi:hypothetical protein